MRSKRSAREPPSASATVNRTCPVSRMRQGAPGVRCWAGCGDTVTSLHARSRYRRGAARRRRCGGQVLEARDEPAARHADISGALELARRQGATLFELRAALDDFGLQGELASAALAHAAGRIPADSAWRPPEQP